MFMVLPDECMDVQHALLTDTRCPSAAIHVMENSLCIEASSKILDMCIIL